MRGARPRLLLVADSCEGGLGAAVKAQALWFSRHGWRVAIAAPDAPMRINPEGGRLTAMDLAIPKTARALRDMLRAARDLRALLHDWPPNTIHAHGLRSLAVAILARSHPYVTQHGLGHVPSDPPGYRFVRTAGLWAAARLARAAFSAAAGMPVTWRFVAHASPKLRDLCRMPFPSDGPPTFVWLGRLSEQKRPEDFVRVAAEMRRAVEFRAWIAGDGPLREPLERLAVTVSAPVEFLGHVEDVAGLMRVAWAVVLISRFEAVTFAAQEAMWAGRPVVASDLPSLRWLIGEDGYLVRSADELRKALHALSDREHARMMGDRAAMRIRRLISADAPWPELERLFREDLARGSWHPERSGPRASIAQCGNRTSDFVQAPSDGQAAGSSPPS